MWRLRLMIPEWARPYGRQLAAARRQLTSRGGMLPDFIIVGAQKAGTTSLFEYLAQHGATVPSSTKEVRFFDGGLDPNDDHFPKGEAWYRAHFTAPRRSRRDFKAFEASPDYLLHPLAPQRMCEMLPDVKIIAVLRNPMERAVSQFFMSRLRKYEPLPMLEAFAAERERLKPLVEAKDYQNPSFRRHSYLLRGEYHDQLQRYFLRFGRENVLVLESSQLLHQPMEALRRVFEFTDLDTTARIDDLRPRHVSMNKTKVDRGCSDFLEAHFEPHNQKLYALLDEDFGW